MSRQISISALYESTRERLGLQWVHEPKARRQKTLASSQDAPVAMVGYMSLIRPFVVQVLAETECCYVASQDDAAVEQLYERLLKAPTACVIVADDMPVDAVLEATAKRTDTALICAQGAGANVVEELQHYVVQHVGKDTSTHGVFLEILGIGVLITGNAGIGKSELALELISRGHRLVADDAPMLRLVGPDRVEGSCPETLQNFMEVRGLGIINVREMFGNTAVKPRRSLGLVIRLSVATPMAMEPGERLVGVRHDRTILGVSIPEITLPVAAGHNLAVLVECSVRNYLLRKNGYDATEAFSEQQARYIGTDDD